MFFTFLLYVIERLACVYVCEPYVLADARLLDSLGLKSEVAVSCHMYAGLAPLTTPPKSPAQAPLVAPLSVCVYGGRC